MSSRGCGFSSDVLATSWRGAHGICRSGFSSCTCCHSCVRIFVLPVVFLNVKIVSRQMINTKAGTSSQLYSTVKAAWLFVLVLAWKQYFLLKTRKKDSAWYTKDAEACNRGYYSFLDWKSSHSVCTWFNKNLLFPVGCPFFAPLLSTEFTSSTWKIAFLCRTNSWRTLRHQSCRACKRSCYLLLYGYSITAPFWDCRPKRGQRPGCWVLPSPLGLDQTPDEAARFSGAIRNLWMGRSLDVFRKTLQ